MRLFTKKFLKEAVHNCVAHPLMSVIGLFSAEKAEEFHNRNADWAFGTRYPANLESTYSMCHKNAEVIWLVKDIWAVAEGLPTIDYPVQLLHSQVRLYLENFDRSDKDRMVGADCSYPIILSSNGYLLDGCHRLAVAIETGKTTVKVVILPKMPKPYGVYGSMWYDGVHYSE